MPYGLSDTLVQQIRDVFKKHPPVWRVVLFGSRAKQIHRIGSDIDLAIVGNELTRHDLLNIQIQLEDLGYLYTFDMNRISNPDLLEHIQRFGQILYEVDGRAVINEQLPTA